MTSLAWLWSLSALAISGMALSLQLKSRKLNGLTMELLHRISRVSEDVRRAHWVRTTMITVVDTAGVVSAYTLEEFYAHHPGVDHTWVSPIAVTMWSGFPDDIMQFQRDLT